MFHFLFSFIFYSIHLKLEKNVIIILYLFQVFFLLKITNKNPIFENDKKNCLSNKRMRTYFVSHFIPILIFFFSKFSFCELVFLVVSFLYFFLILIGVLFNVCLLLLFFFHDYYNTHNFFSFLLLLF